MLNPNRRNYFNQVNMVESQYDSKRLNNSNNSSLIQNRSPLRERENISLNTPTRLNNPKKSLSPLRSRKNEPHNASGRSTIAKNKPNQFECQNHPTKPAKFYVESETQLFYYCENCAVRLASQGFSTIRIADSGKQSNPRVREINQFLQGLEKSISCLQQKKILIDCEIGKSQNSLEQEIEKIEEFYSQFYQLIDEHKNRVIEELRSEYDSASEEVQMFKSKVEDALKNSENMRKDINESLSEVILDAPEYEFRPVMDLYKSNISKFRAIYQDQQSLNIKTKSLRFRGDEEAVCQKLLEELIVEWDEQEGKCESEEEEDRKNPVESLQSEQRDGKSNLKQLGQLFSSFDE